jgi:hypothetical protein
MRSDISGSTTQTIRRRRQGIMMFLIIKKLMDVD